MQIGMGQVAQAFHLFTCFFSSTCLTSTVLHTGNGAVNKVGKSFHLLTVYIPVGTGKQINKLIFI
jgi:hypothetical protein